MKTKNQNSALPTRKMWAVMIAAVVVALARQYIPEVLPMLDNNEFYTLIENVVSVFIITGAGYATKEWADAADSEEV